MKVPSRRTPAGRKPAVLQQYAEICTDTRSVSAVRLRGQVTLRANDAAGRVGPLRPEDLGGTILVFTGRSPRRAVDKTSRGAGGAAAR